MAVSRCYTVRAIPIATPVREASRLLGVTRPLFEMLDGLLCMFPVARICKTSCVQAVMLFLHIVMHMGACNSSSIQAIAVCTDGLLQYSRTEVE